MYYLIPFFLFSLSAISCYVLFFSSHRKKVLESSIVVENHELVNFSNNLDNKIIVMKYKSEVINGLSLAENDIFYVMLSDNLLVHSEEAKATIAHEYAHLLYKDLSFFKKFSLFIFLSHLAIVSLALLFPLLIWTFLALLIFFGENYYFTKKSHQAEFKADKFASQHANMLKSLELIRDEGKIVDRATPTHPSIKDRITSLRSLT